MSTTIYRVVQWLFVAVLGFLSASSWHDALSGEGLLAIWRPDRQQILDWLDSHMIINTINITNFISYRNSGRCKWGETFGSRSILWNGWSQININDAYDYTWCSFFCILFAWFFFSVEIRTLIVKVLTKEGVGVAPHGEPDLTLANGKIRFNGIICSIKSHVAIKTN